MWEYYCGQISAATAYYFLKILYKFTFLYILVFYILLETFYNIKQINGADCGLGVVSQSSSIPSFPGHLSKWLRKDTEPSL